MANAIVNQLGCSDSGWMVGCSDPPTGLAANHGEEHKPKPGACYGASQPTPFWTRGDPTWKQRLDIHHPKQPSLVTKQNQNLKMGWWWSAVNFHWKADEIDEIDDIDEIDEIDEIPPWRTCGKNSKFHSGMVRWSISKIKNSPMLPHQLDALHP